MATTLPIPNRAVSRLGAINLVIMARADAADDGRRSLAGWDSSIRWTLMMVLAASGAPARSPWPSSQFPRPRGRERGDHRPEASASNLDRPADLSTRTWKRTWARIENCGSVAASAWPGPNPKTPTRTSWSSTASAPGAGNPNLLPEESHAFEISYETRPPGATPAATAYARLSLNGMTDVSR
jgi:hypothetical protein